MFTAGDKVTIHGYSGARKARVLARHDLGTPAPFYTVRLGTATADRSVLVHSSQVTARS